MVIAAIRDDLGIIIKNILLLVSNCDMCDPVTVSFGLRRTHFHPSYSLLGESVSDVHLTHLRTLES